MAALLHANFRPVRDFVTNFKKDIQKSATVGNLSTGKDLGTPKAGVCLEQANLSERNS